MKYRGNARIPEPAISPTINNTAKVTVNPPFDFSSPRKDVVSSFLLSEFSLVVLALRNFSISGEWEIVISYTLRNFSVQCPLPGTTF